MEDKKTLLNKGCACECGHKKLLCWAIGFAVLVIVFCIGVKVGQLQTYLRAFYGQDYYGYRPSTMMRWNNDYNQEDGYGYGMMRGWRYSDESLPVKKTTSSTSTASTTK